MGDVPPLAGRIAQLSFKERRQLPHFFRLLSIAMQLYRQHALAYIVIGLIPYVLVQLLQATVLSSLTEPLASGVGIGLSIVFQLVSILAIIEFARKGNEATIGGALTTGLRTFPLGLLAFILILLASFGAIALIVGPVLLIFGIPVGEVLTSPILFFFAALIGVVALCATALGMYVLVYERTQPQVALLRAFAYDRSSRFAVWTRFLALGALGIVVLLAVIYSGLKLFQFGVLSQGALASFDDIVTVILLPLFTLYGSALYEVARVEFGSASANMLDRSVLWGLSALALLALIVVLF